MITSLKSWLAVWLTVAGVGLAATGAIPITQLPDQRTYWPVPLDSLAIGHVRHTHVEVRGEVIYVRSESDGDRHIKIADPWDHAKFIIAECIPRLPCIRPAVGAAVTAGGRSTP
jgi:hypothetical protein